MHIHTIGTIRTCYGEKFGVPRQPGVVKEAWGEMTFTPEFRNSDSVRGLEGFSHVWLLFVFHQNATKKTTSNWKPLVRPPRLGGNDKVGVFASRSPFRPNPIGMSCVKLESIDLDHPDGPVLKLSGVDLVDGTPIIDIKPYVPYSDALPDAIGGFANHAPEKIAVTWHEEANSEKLTNQLRKLIEATLAEDPRPAYQQTSENSDRQYGCLIEGINVRWTVEDQTIVILSYSPHSLD